MRHRWTGAGLGVAARDSHGVAQTVEAVGAKFRLGAHRPLEILLHRRTHRALFRAVVKACIAARGAQVEETATEGKTA